MKMRKKHLFYKNKSQERIKYLLLVLWFNISNHVKENFGFLPIEST